MGCVAAMALFFACSKKDDPQNQDYQVEIKMQKDDTSPLVPINVHIYKTKEDYNTGANVYITGKTATDGRLNIPVSKLQKDHVYFVDWFSDDFTYSNWADFTDRQQLLYNDAVSNYHLGALGEFQNRTRKIYLDGNKTETNWKAVDAYDYEDEGSVWGSMKENEKQLKIKVRKGLTGVISTMGVTGEVTTEDFTFEPRNQLGLTLSGNRSGGIINPHENGGPDTITYIPMQAPRKYLMIKE